MHAKNKKTNVGQEKKNFITVQAVLFRRRFSMDRREGNEQVET